MSALQNFHNVLIEIFSIIKFNYKWLKNTSVDRICCSTAKMSEVFKKEKYLKFNIYTDWSSRWWNVSLRANTFSEPAQPTSISWPT